MGVIGQMRHRLTLQQETRTGDGAGGYSLGWADVATVWAALTPLSGREVMLPRAEGRVTHRALLRYRADVTVGMRVLDDGRALNIRAVLNQGARDRFLQLLLEEGGPV